MAAMAAATSATALTMALSAPCSVEAKQNGSAKRGRVANIPGMNLYGGLKAQNKIMNMSCAQSIEQQFAQLQQGLCRAAAKGGALTSTCNVASEILRVIPIMSGMTLLGIAVGFILLRVEASLEESE